MTRTGKIVGVYWLIAIAFALYLSPQFVYAARLTKPIGTANSQIKATIAKVPLSFEENLGQATGQVKFVSRVPGMTLSILPAEMTLTLAPEQKAEHTSSKQQTIRLKLVNGDKNSNIVAEAIQPGKSNYLIGNDSSKWKTGVARYGRVRQKDVYPGIDLVYHGSNDSLEYDLVVAPGVDPTQIRLAYSGVEKLTINRNGDLLLSVGDSQIIQKRPLVYQEIDGVRKEIESKYLRVRGSHVKFSVAAYDVSKPLVIDPVLTYGTYLGGTDFDTSSGIAVDSAGNAYIVGYTSSTDFPTSTTGYKRSLVGSQSAIVAKIDTTTGTLVYSTYIGGNVFGNSRGTAIAIDAAGNAYVTGDTTSKDFPIVSGFQTTHSEGGASGIASQSDAFIAKFNSTGSTLLFSSYLGGSTGEEIANGIAVDNAGAAYIVGNTGSTNFPVSGTAYQSTKRDNLGPNTYDAFVAKIDTVSHLKIYATYIGGNANEFGAGIAIDDSGNATIVGNTSSTDFPVISGSYDTTPNPNYIVGYVSKVNSTGSALIYSTFVKSVNSFAQTDGIAIDSDGNAFITGVSDMALPGASVFPLGSSQPFNRGVYVAKLNPSGSALLQSAWVFGAQEVYGISKRNDGTTYVTGYAGQLMTISPTQSISPNSRFILRLPPALDAIGFGYAFDTQAGLQNRSGTIAVDSTNNVYVVAHTSGFQIPTTAGALQTSPNGGTDIVLLKLSDNSIPTTTSLAIAQPSPTRAGQTLTLNATVAGAATGNVTFNDGGLMLGTAPVNGGVATLSSTIPTAGTHNLSATFNGTPPAEPSTSQNVALTLNKAIPGVHLDVSSTEVEDGDHITVVATVTGANPTGFVTFQFKGNGVATSPIGFDGRASAELVITGFGEGDVRADYSGDTNNEAAESNTTTVTSGGLGSLFGGGGGCVMKVNQPFDPVLLLSFMLSLGMVTRIRYRKS